MSVSSAPHARRRLGVGAAVVVVFVAAGMSVFLGVVRSASTPVEEIPYAESSAQPAAVYVHVFGAVAKPGLYRLADGARVVDVVAAAGGLQSDADTGAVNLARRLADGEQLYVPAVGETIVDSPGTSPAGDGRVNLNTADAAALETLPRIGPALAERILAWRDENGRFTSVEDLLAVPGIGEKMLEGLRDVVTV